MAKLSAEELRKLKEQSNSTADRPRKQKGFFFCVICREFKQGNAKASLSIAGWCCAHHQTPMGVANG